VSWGVGTAAAGWRWFVRLRASSPGAPPALIAHLSALTALSEQRQRDPCPTPCPTIERRATRHDASGPWPVRAADFWRYRVVRLDADGCAPRSSKDGWGRSRDQRVLYAWLRCGPGRSRKAVVWAMRGAPVVSKRSPAVSKGFPQRRSGHLY
jgi:hypothetical protein